MEKQEKKKLIWELWWRILVALWIVALVTFVRVLVYTGYIDETPSVERWLIRGIFVTYGFYMISCVILRPLWPLLLDSKFYEKTLDPVVEWAAGIISRPGKHRLSCTGIKVIVAFLASFELWTMVKALYLLHEIRHAEVEHYIGDVVNLYYADSLTTSLWLSFAGVVLGAVAALLWYYRAQVPAAEERKLSVVK